MICILYLKVFHLKFYVFTYPKNLCPAWFVLSKCDLASELIFYQFEGVVDVFLSDCIIRLFHLTVHLRKKAKWKYNSIFFFEFTAESRIQVWPFLKWVNFPWFFLWFTWKVSAWKVCSFSFEKSSFKIPVSKVQFQKSQFLF